MGARFVTNPVVCIVGPTASGKSALAIRIACELGGEVVSADSMQVYRGMDVGTGKVPPGERIVEHHCLDLVDPGEPFSAALYQEAARECFCGIDRRGRRAVLCGGTGFYVRAAIDDYDFPAGEQTGNDVRDAYNEIAETRGAQALWDELHDVDPESARVIPANDVKRLVRAFELLEQGESYAAQKRKLASIAQAVPAVFVGLQVDPDVLRSRIDERVDQMFRDGLIDEVRGLLEAGFRDGITARQAIGYKEVVSALDGEISMDEAAQQIKTATHRYAKRQRTWFRKDGRIRWIDADSLNLDDMTKRALDIVAACDSM